MKRLLPLLALVMLGACNLDVPAPEGADSGPSHPAKETFAPDLHIDIPSMTKTAAGTYYKDAKVGTGAELTATSRVVVLSYLGFLKTAVRFAAAVQETQAVDALVGGLRDAMRGMKVGGERIIVIPSELGYGALGTSLVPPNSTLIFDVILDQLP